MQTREYFGSHCFQALLVYGRYSRRRGIFLTLAALAMAGMLGAAQAGKPASRFDEARLMQWMFPYDIPNYAAVVQCAEELKAGYYTRSTFENPRLDEYFTDFLSFAIAEVLVNSPFGGPLQEDLLSYDCHATILQFGEGLGSKGVGDADFFDLTVVTALTPIQLWYPDQYDDYNYDGLKTIPLYAIPLYEQFIIHHELGHVFQGWPRLRQFFPECREWARDLYNEAMANGLALTRYSTISWMEYWAEATGIYFCPVPFANMFDSAQIGEDEDEGNGYTGAALDVIRANLRQNRGRLRMSGADLIREVQPELYQFLVELYGEPNTYTFTGLLRR
ncbi:MAG: hypothetical protein HYV35_00415 [Lentisphaerae bacterium]|nr:hypothetical protein [Lentisphaerota bacterium]